MAHDEMERRDEVLARATEALQRPVALDPWLDQRIMRAVRARSAPRGLVAWWRRVHWFALTPLQAAAAAALVLATGAATGAVVARRSRDTAPATALAVASATTMAPVTFLFHAPHAQRVALVGSFNQWDGAAAPMRALPGGVWRIELRLPAGWHAYSFLVDGQQWVADPEALRTAEEDFGRASSVLLVPGAQS